MLAAATAVAALATTPCNVLTLSGGGSFGAFEAGVLHQLTASDSSLDFDFLLGVSAGSMNAAYLSTWPQGPQGLADAAAGLKELWSTTRSRNVWRPWLFPTKRGEPGLVDTAPLRATLEAKLAPRTVQRKVTIGMTSLATGVSTLVSEAELGRNLTTLTLASAAIPVVFPPIEYNGSRFVDGGLSSNIVTLRAIDRCHAAGKTDVVLTIVLCSPPIPQVSPETTRDWGFVEIATREYAVASAVLFDHALRYKCAPGVTSPIRTRVFYPGPDAFGSDPLAAINFDHGAEYWSVGNATGPPDEWYYCL